MKLRVSKENISWNVCQIWLKRTAPSIIAGWGGTTDKKRRVPSNDIVAILKILSALDMFIFFVRICKLHILLS